MTKKYKKIFKYGELTKAILNHVIDSVLAGYTAIESRRGPSISDLIDGLSYLLTAVKKASARNAKVLRALKNLEKKEIIDLVNEDDKVYVYLKDKNHPKVIEYSIKSLFDFKKKKKQWNGKWFLVFFDVPETQRNKRNYLRKFLKQLGFYPYQKSVYLFPYDCEKEVGLIKKIVEGAKYMKYVIADKIEDEPRAKVFFDLP